MKQYRSATNAFSYGIDTGLIPIRYGQIRILLLPIIMDFSSVSVFFFFFFFFFFLDNYQGLAADRPGPVNNTRKGTDITDKIRIVTDKKDKYGSPIRSVRSVRKC